MSQVVDVQVKLGDVERGLGDMEARASTLNSVFQALKRPARQDQEDHARRAMGRDGPWPRRSQATLEKLDDRVSRIVISKRKRKSWRAGTRVTIRTVKRQIASNILGRLPGGVRFSVRGGRELVGRNRVTWSGVHNEGGVAGHNARIPEREFLWFSDRFLEVMTDAVELHVVSGWDPSIRVKRLGLSL